jgi:SAM-dependent methyltransferase
MKQKLQRLAGLSMIADGLLLFLFGRRYGRLWRLGVEEGLYFRIVHRFTALPGWLLRLLGLGEVMAGVKVLGSVPLSVAGVYGAMAGSYSVIDTRWRNWFYIDAHREFDAALAKYLPPDGRVLDLGAGTGANLGRLLEMELPFAAYTAVDTTEAMLEQARLKYGHVPQATFHQLDLMTDPLPAGTFDLIVSTWALEHMDDPALVVDKAWRRLAPGGHMALLFEVAADNFYSHLENRVLGFFDAAQVPTAVVRQMPGLIQFDPYGGPFGKLALAVLAKGNEQEVKN